jgi:hypothetical protein
MDINRRRALGWLLATPGITAAAASDPDHQAMSWQALLPRGWSTQAVLGELRLDSIDDNDPEIEEIQRRVRALLDSAPPNPEVHNRRVRIQGYLVPLEFARAGEVSEFLLVPYYGACIHEPAPPANQVVHVTPATPVGSDVRGAVSVAGTLIVARAVSGKGVAGYRMSGADVKPYRK